MKKIILLAVFSLFTTLAVAQKVKIKKGVALIDDVEVYKVDREGGMETIATMGGNEFVTVLSTTYEERNPAHYRPNGHNFPATITRWVYTVKFLESGRELTTDVHTKEIIKAIYKADMVAADGKIDEEKLNVLINKYNNENLKYKL